MLDADEPSSTPLWDLLIGSDLVLGGLTGSVSLSFFHFSFISFSCALLPRPLIIDLILMDGFYLNYHLGFLASPKSVLGNGKSAQGRSAPSRRWKITSASTLILPSSSTSETRRQSWRNSTTSRRSMSRPFPAPRFFGLRRAPLPSLTPWWTIRSSKRCGCSSWVARSPACAPGMLEGTATLSSLCLWISSSTLFFF